MSDTTKELSAELKKNLGQLQTLRDEVRVRIHLAGMEAKDRWNELEPRLAQVEQTAKEVGEASREAVTDAVKALKDLRSKLH